MGQHLMPEGAAPATPSIGYVAVYAKADGLLYSKDDAGVETSLGNTSTGTNTGDQIASTVPNTPAGNIVATDVQAAINELDTEKLSPADIGVTVQAYDADLTTWAGVTPGTGVATALAVNTGSAGAPVLFDGAGGTPSSLTLTNATGLPASVVTGLTAGKAQQVDQTVAATVRAATTDFTGESLEGTLSDTGVAITAFHGVAGITYKRKCLGVGDITAGAGLTILQGGVTITTAANDTFEVYMLTATTCEVRNYQRATAVSFSVHKNGTNQSIPNSTDTKVTFSTEEFDIGGYFDTTNSRFTPPTGYYNFNASVTLQASTNTNIIFLSLYKNGVSYKLGIYNRASGTGAIGADINCIAAANGTDYFELYVYQDNGTQNVSGAAANSYFTGHRIGDL